MDLHLNTPPPLIAKISAALNNLPAEACFSAQSGVLVAISGGPDSTALLVALHLLARQVEFKFRACHINHRLRGEESDQDEQFCKMVCEKLGIELDVYRVAAEDVKAEASESDLRATRYDFLFRCAQSDGCRFLMLGHTTNDQVETVLFRFLRGTSPAGLSGIKSAHQMRNGIWLLRPLLTSSRSEVNEFLEYCGVVPQQDASNKSSKFARNFLRNEVIPLCLTRFPTLERQVERLRELVACDDEYLNQATGAVLNQLGGALRQSWSTETFSSVHLALQRRLLAQSFECREIEVSFERVQAVLNVVASAGSCVSRISLNQRWDVAVDSSKIEWIDKQAVVEDYHFNPVAVKVPGRTMLLQSGQVLTVELHAGHSPMQFPSRSDMEAYVDLTATSGPLLVRLGSEGDRITPLGMSQSVSLKRYLKSNKSRSSRNSRKNFLQTIVVADGNEVLWVPGVGLNEKIRVRENPTHHLAISAISADFVSA
ncbi:MAG: tRNA lysidine(34) synthetase TilS [Candidatus Obscuribacterales bacterium]